MVRCLAQVSELRDIETRRQKQLILNQVLLCPGVSCLEQKHLTKMIYD